MILIWLDSVRDLLSFFFLCQNKMFDFFFIYKKKQ